MDICITWPQWVNAKNVTTLELYLFCIKPLIYVFIFEVAALTLHLRQNGGQIHPPPNHDKTKQRLDNVHMLGWWRHQMETFSALLAGVGNSPVTGEFPAQRPVMRSFNVSLIWAWINSWVNKREAGDLRHHNTHYDVIVMWIMWNQTLILLQCRFHITSD